MAAKMSANSICGTKFMQKIITVLRSDCQKRCCVASHAKFSKPMMEIAWLYPS